MSFVKVHESYINPAAVAVITYDPGEHVHGIQVRPPRNDACLIHTISGAKISVEGITAAELAELLERESR